MKIFLWFVSTDTNFLEGAIKTFERLHGRVEIVGAAAGGEISEVAPKNFFDVLLVVGAKKIGMNKITQAARQINLPEEKLLGDWIVCIPGFSLEKYRRLQRARLSVCSMNCFGGLISHALGLPFYSPFVNLHTSEEEFVRFFRAPRVYMEKKLILKEMFWNEVLKYHHPIVELGDITFVMTYYRDFDEATKIWERRKERINWYNLFVTMFTEDEKILREFDKLPYGKKICFVPFKSDLDSAWYINREILKDLPFWNIVDLFGTGQPFYYDPFDMLLYGKKTQLIDM